MASTYYSDNYQLGQDGSTYESKGIAVPLRPGEVIAIRGSRAIPTSGRTAGDVVQIAEGLPEGLRCVGGQVTATGANGSLTVDIGYGSDPDAIVAASTAFQSAASTALTPAQVAAAKKTAANDTLIATLGGTVGSTATTFTFLLLFAKLD
jgi:hypothetical protein